MRKGTEKENLLQKDNFEDGSIRISFLFIEFLLNVGIYPLYLVLAPYSCELAMYGAIFLTEENDRLRAEVQRQKKKAEARKSYVTYGGILTIGEGLQLAIDKENGGKRSGATSRPSSKQATPRLCSGCKQPGHNIRRCSRVRNSIHVAI